MDNEPKKVVHTEKIITVGIEAGIGACHAGFFVQKKTTEDVTPARPNTPVIAAKEPTK